MSNKCPHCGTGNASTYTHCMACGRSLVVQARPAQAPRPADSGPAAAVQPAPAPWTPDVRRLASQPGIALMILGGIAIVQALMVMAVGSVNMFTGTEEDVFAGILVMGYLAFTVAACILIVVGGNSLRTLGNSKLAWIGTIIALIPCFTFYCFMPGIGLGIWAISVLNKPEVKTAFRS